MSLERSTPELLGISAELRNIIYRMVLVDEEDIEVTLSTYREPALLKVSREVRNEALSIYYCENDFLLEIESFDPTLAVRWTQRMTMLDNVGDMSFVVRFDSSAHWPNLMLWLQHVHSGAIEADLDMMWPEIPNESDSVDAIEDFISIMICQIEELRATEWVHVEKAMGHFRGLFEGFEDSWTGTWGSGEHDDDETTDDASDRSGSSEDDG